MLGWATVDGIRDFFMAAPCWRARASQATRGGRFGVVVPALARMAQQCDVERQPEAVLRAPARTDQIKIISGQKIVALQRSDVGGNPE